MPNGISCAYFAARNHIYGQKEDNPFKEGIAGIQAARTIDAVAKTGFVTDKVSSNVVHLVNGTAGFGKKIVYPLIIGSGVYNTVKAEDKVKTGSSQVGGISVMYLFEKYSEKLLDKANKLFLQSSKLSNNKLAGALWYIAQGMTFVGASLAGYSVGSKSAEKCVDTFRGTKSNSKVPKAVNAEKIKNEDKIVAFPLEDGLNESQIFAEMKL